MTSGLLFCFLADDAVPLALTYCDVQQLLGWFAAKCEAVDDSQIAPSGLVVNCCPKYHRDFTIDSKMECVVDR